MNLVALALASAAIGFCGLVQAQPASAYFTLTQGPALSDGATPPPGQTAAGRWTGKSSWADSYTELASGETTGARISSEPVADFWNGGFGNAAVSSHDASSGDRIFASAQVLPDRLSATVDLIHPEPSDHGTADALWSGNFELDPHSSVTFAGIGNFGIEGMSVPALGYVDEFDRECDPYHHGAIGGWEGDCSETISAYHNFFPAGAEWGTLRFQGGFDDLTPDQLAGLDFETLASARLTGFSYSTGEDGELSMTLTNHLDVVSTGYFEVMMGMTSTAPPVPEPQAYLCMLLGLGALGGFSRGRAKA